MAIAMANKNENCNKEACDENDNDMMSDKTLISTLKVIISISDDDMVIKICSYTKYSMLEISKFPFVEIISV